MNRLMDYSVSRFLHNPPVSSTQWRFVIHTTKQNQTAIEPFPL